MIGTIMDAIVDLTGPVTVDLTSPVATAMPVAASVSPEEQQGEVSPEEEEDEELQFLGTVNFSVVGIRYYRGEAHPGEFLTLAREPHNPYDRNAIRIDNLRGEKVGHVKREQAAALSHILDGPLDVKVDATIPYPGNQWTLPLKIEFYGSDVNLALQVRRVLKKHRIGLQQCPLGDKASNSNAKQPAVVVQKKSIDWKTQQKELDDMFEKESKEKMLNLPAMEMPAAFGEVELLEHQIDGIRWLCHRETGNIEPPFFKKVTEQKKVMWLSEITSSSQSTPPKPITGGILAGMR